MAASLNGVDKIGYSIHVELHSYTQIKHAAFQITGNMVEEELQPPFKGAGVNRVYVRRTSLAIPQGQNKEYKLFP